jgi:hypothetical protein
MKNEHEVGMPIELAQSLLRELMGREVIEMEGTITFIFVPENENSTPQTIRLSLRKCVWNSSLVYLAITAT